jgi:HSP20 family protein
MARDDDRQYRMPARQQEPGRLTRSPFGWGSETDPWGGSPFQMMRRMQEEMDRALGSFFGPQSGSSFPWAGAGAQSMANWSPSMDVYETDKEIVVKAEVPGVEPEDIEVYCTDDALILRGETRREDERQEGNTHRIERRSGRFERQIPLPPGAIPDQAQANFRNGVLELRIPKSEEARQRVRRIPVGGVTGSKGGEAGSPPAGGARQEKAKEQTSPAGSKDAKK